MLLMMLACAGSQGDPTFGSSRTSDTGPSPADDSQTYYVSPDGDDSHKGSADRPLRTLQAAADSARPGDTFVVMPGEYGSVKISKGGTQFEPVTFVAETQGTAVLNGKRDLEYGVFFEDVSHVVFSGFEVRDFYWEAIRVDGRDLVISDNFIHDIGDRRESAGQWIRGIYESDNSERNQYMGNTITDVGRSLDSPSDFLRDDHALWIGGDEAMVANNLFADNDTGWGVYVSGTTNVVETLTITNNTFIQGARHVQLEGAMDTVMVQNNIFYDPQDSYESINFEVDAETLRDVTVRYNIGWPIGVADACTICTVEDNLDGVDPGLADIAGRSPYLGAGSAAIDAGVQDSSPQTDIDGDPRPAGRTVDIGAHEVQ